MTRTSTFSMTWPRTSSLLDTFSPPMTAAVEALGAAERRLQRLELGLHQPAGIGGAAARRGR